MHRSTIWTLAQMTRQFKRNRGRGKEKEKERGQTTRRMVLLRGWSREIAGEVTLSSSLNSTFLLPLSLMVLLHLSFFLPWLSSLYYIVFYNMFLHHILFIIACSKIFRSCSFFLKFLTTQHHSPVIIMHFIATYTSPLHFTQHNTPTPAPTLPHILHHHLN